MHTLASMVMEGDLIAEVADSEAGLIRSSLKGDQDAFAALVRRHQNRVFRLAGRFFRRREEVEEVAQETFLRAWMKLGTYPSRTTQGLSRTISAGRS